ncbi:hypothetical protein BMS3Abin05_00008 [bacterium BMS3Abin05]|nr:hypothetical protein BMS3Abin05_00008 [bacterium BMS3Abin05]HDK35730.1 hypothetical protein [Bacteroidota bacterium]
MRKLTFLCIIWIVLSLQGINFAQDRRILVPKRVPGAPFKLNDTEDLFGKAYRWFLEGEYDFGADSLRKLVKLTGFKIDPGSYYVVAANFTDSFTPIGLFHEKDDFNSTRLFGLNRSNLFYIFISRQRKGASFLSVLATKKMPPFLENLPGFIGLFQPLPFAQITPEKVTQKETWIDIRHFDVPKPFRKFSDISFIVKAKLSSEKFLASATFDNTSKERWSYGVATAVTSAKDVEITVGSNGKIIVRPRPDLDLAAFGVINYNFRPVDTKAPTLATSFHLLCGLRLADFLEPIIGVGGGINLDVISVHLFAGYSVEIANELKQGYFIGQQINRAVDPFKTKLLGKPRFGIELKFP